MSSSKDRIGDVVRSVPVDRTAAAVVRKGVHHDAPTDQFTMVSLSETPLPVRAAPPDAPNISGAQFGRLTVIGLSDRPGRWVVRCSCGLYTVRKLSSLRRGEMQMCNRCDYTLRLAGDTGLCTRCGRVSNMGRVCGRCAGRKP